MDTAMVRQGSTAKAKASEVAKAVDEAQDVHVVYCPNGRVIAGYGSVGLVEIRGTMTLADIENAAAIKRSEVKAVAADAPDRLYEFTVL